MSSNPTLDAVCAQGLPGAPELEGAGSWDWDQLLADALDERAVAIVASVVAAQRWQLSREHQSSLNSAHESVMQACLRLERATLELVERLEGVGIEYRLLKGPAVAHLDYPGPAWRSFGDVDVLVRARDYDATVRMLSAVGAHRRSAEVRPGFDRRFGKGVCMVGPDGVQIDVHRALASGPFGHTIDLDALFGCEDTVSFGGRGFPVLSREHRFVHACVHAALGDVAPRIVALRDVAQLLLTTDLDVDQAIVNARAWRMSSVVAAAIESTWDRFGLEATPVSRWADGYRGGRFERRALAAYQGPHRSYARQMIAGVPAIPGTFAKAAYVRSLLVVNTDYARSHDGGSLRRGVRALRSLTRVGGTR